MTKKRVTNIVMMTVTGTLSMKDNHTCEKKAGFLGRILKTDFKDGF
jgi:hypothetical protein